MLQVALDVSVFVALRGSQSPVDVQESPGAHSAEDVQFCAQEPSLRQRKSPHVAEVQQTPSVQNPLPQWTLSMHSVPNGRMLSQLSCRHRVSSVQSLCVLQDKGQVGLTPSQR